MKTVIVNGLSLIFNLSSFLGTGPKMTKTLLITVMITTEAII